MDESLGLRLIDSLQTKRINRIFIALATAQTTGPQKTAIMLGLLLLYFIGKYYFNLAGKYGKRKWPYAILGIGTYYGSSFLGGVLVGLALGLVAPETLETMPAIAYDAIALPFGLLGCWGVYAILKSKWEPREVPSNSELLDDFEITE